MSDLYREIILHEAAHPQKKGSLANPTHQQDETNASCGDKVTVQLTVKDDRIAQVAWQGAGCAISQASMSLIAAFVEGKTTEEVEKIATHDVLDLLGLEEITPGREKCMLLGLRAIQVALKHDITTK